jgi:hypothetical protein
MAGVVQHLTSFARFLAHRRLREREDGLALRALAAVPLSLPPGLVVSFVPSLHSKLLLGYRVPFDGELTCEHLDALSFDDFFRPLDAPLGFSTNVNLAALPDEIAAVSSDFRVAALEPVLPTRTPTERNE